MGAATVLETDVFNGEAGHAVKHNAVNAQVNWLTEQVPLLVVKDKTDTVLGQSYTLRTVKAARTSVYRESFVRSATSYMGGDPFENTTWGWGFNMGPTFSKIVGTDPMFRIGMEGSWLDPGTGFKWSELHLGAYIDAASAGSEIRPLSIGVVHGGDGGMGSPSVSFCISDTLAAGGFVVANVAGDQLMAFGSAAWYFKRNVNITRGAGATSALFIGDHLNSAGLTFDAKAAGGVNSITFLRDGANKWLFYDAGSSDFYFRDTGHGVMQLSLISGTTSDNRFSDFDGGIRTNRDVMFTGGAAYGPVLKSPDGTNYRIKVANGGALSTVAA